MKDRNDAFPGLILLINEELYLLQSCANASIPSTLV